MRITQGRMLKMTSNFIPNDLSETKTRDSVSKCKEYLKVAYNKYIYEFFKNDHLLKPIEYTPKNERNFGLTRHKEAWLNVPTLTTVYTEWMYKINLCLSCAAYESFEISIGTDSKEANLQFIRLISNEAEREKLLIEFSKLDNHYYTFLFCRKGKAPPRKDMKETFVYYQTNKINNGDLEEIKKNITYWLNQGSSDLIYPHMRIIRRTSVKEEQITGIINQIKPLISLLIDFENNDFKQQQEFKKEQKEKEKRLKEHQERVQVLNEKLKRLDDPQQRDRINLERLGDRSKEDLDMYIKGKKKELEEELANIEGL